MDKEIEEMGDLIFQTLREDEFTVHSNKAYIADLVSEALDKAGYVLPVADAERRERVEDFIRQASAKLYDIWVQSPNTTERMFAKEEGVRNWLADSILRLQPTLLEIPLLTDEEISVHKLYGASGFAGYDIRGLLEAQRNLRSRSPETAT